MIKTCKCNINHRFPDAAPPKFYKCQYCGEVLLGTDDNPAPAAPAIPTLPNDLEAGAFALQSDIDAAQKNDADEKKASN